MLEDVVVLEVADVITGPLAGMLLADFGAQVIKIEPPEWKRSLETRLAKRDDPIFLSINRGKQSIVLDLTMPEGRKIFEELVMISDIVLSNSRPSVFKKLGLDYETLGKINPRLICCNISGYGIRGRDIERPAFDLAIQAVSGLISITGEEKRPPVPVGAPIVDQRGGIIAVLSILAAYIKLQKEGVGQQLDISMFDNMMLSFSDMAIKYYSKGIIPQRKGLTNAADKRVDFRAYETKDGYVVVSSGRGNEKWKNFCKAIGKNELAADARYDAYEKRVQDDVRIQLERLIEPIFRTKTTEEWLENLVAADVPCAPVNTLDKALEKSEDMGRDMIVDVPLPYGGTVKGIGNPIKVGTTLNLNAPPRFGEHTKEILTTRLNYSEADISQLGNDKAVFIGK